MLFEKQFKKIMYLIVIFAEKRDFQHIFVICGVKLR